MRITKKHIFVLGLSSMFLPLILSYLSVNEAPFDILKLSNDSKIVKPYFEWNKFLSAEGLSSKERIIDNHTKKVEEHLNQNFGFHALYVKLRNQIDYSLFRNAHANSVIVGKDGYLFEEQYIKSYYGQDYIGQDSINKKVEKLRFIQKELETQGKLVFVVIAPGKGSFYPEYIPEKYESKKGTTNYDGYVKAFEKNNINYIDFNKYFLEQKKITGNQPVLYPKTGIHWSQNAMYNSLDSIFDYIEEKKHYKLTRFTLEDRKPGNDVQFKDNDIEQGLNLFFDLDHLKMSYPKFKFDEPKDQDRPSILTISDSFYWQMYNLGISHHVFEDGKFWFYNRTVHPESDNGTNYMTDQVNIFEEIQKRDIIMLMATEANLHKFSYGFIEEAHQTLVAGIENYKKRIAEITIQIRNSQSWYADIERKAIEKGVSIDEMLLIDAQYVYKLELQNK